MLVDWCDLVVEIVKRLLDLSDINVIDEESSLTGNDLHLNRIVGMLRSERTGW